MELNQYQNETALKVLVGSLNPDTFHLEHLTCLWSGCTCTSYRRGLILVSRARNPRFWCPLLVINRGSCPHERNKNRGFRALHQMLLLSFVSSCKVVTKDHSIPEKPTHRITIATIFCNHLANLLQKIAASQKNQHIASHVATIFCIILQSCYKI